LIVANPWLFDLDKKLQEASDAIGDAREAMGTHGPPWDETLWRIRLAKEKLAIAAVDLAAARSAYARGVRAEGPLNAGVGQDEEPEGTLEAPD